MKKRNTEIIVGLFICMGILCMAYTSIKLGKVELFDNDYYQIKASFTSATGLKEDTNVEISGVRVGKVTGIALENYQAIVTMLIKNGIEIQDDAIASIKTNGILGEKYIDILPGGSTDLIEAGGLILDTEPPFDLLSVIKNLVIDGDD